MTKIAVRTADPVTPPLGKADWIAAALRVFIDEGIDAVQITRLARRLEVSRGSFYWHFSDRKDLLDAVLEEWRAANSPVIGDELSKAGSLSDGILAFFTVWEFHGRFDRHLDQAVRDWARLDDTVLEIVRDEDQTRIEIIAGFLERFGYEPAEAVVPDA